MTSAANKEELKVVGTRPIRPDGAEKVTGQANFGADMAIPGHAWSARSSAAHIRMPGSSRIDTGKAMALPGVKRGGDGGRFPEIRPEEAFVGEGPMNFRDLSSNVMARDKALYEGHAVAAVAATSSAIADEALALIAVEYEVLPHVIDVEAAMAPDAPVLHDHLFTAGVSRKAVEPLEHRQAQRFKRGDLGAGFAEADVVVEGRYTTRPCTRATSSRMPASLGRRRRPVPGVGSSQGQFMIRTYCAKVLGLDIADIRVTPAEIGGGFGGKTTVYLEPVALALSRQCGHPVKMVMTRDEVFRATGPTSGGVIEVKLGAKADGTLVAADVLLKYQAGAFPGSPVGPGSMTALACYDVPNFSIVGYDVVTNPPKVAAYRAPGAPISAFGVESAMDDLALKLGMDPIALREKNAVRDGVKAAYGPTFRNIGYVETLEAIKNHPHYAAPLGPNQGRGVAVGFWFNIGGEVDRGSEPGRGRHGGGGHRQPRHRRLARLDGHDGRGGPGPAGGEG